MELPNDHSTTDLTVLATWFVASRKFHRGMHISPSPRTLPHSTESRYRFQRYNVEWKGGYELLKMFKQHIFGIIAIIFQKSQAKSLYLCTSLRVSIVTTTSLSLHILHTHTPNSFVRKYIQKSQSITRNQFTFSAHTSRERTRLVTPLDRNETFRSILQLHWKSVKQSWNKIYIERERE